MPSDREITGGIRWFATAKSVEHGDPENFRDETSFVVLENNGNQTSGSQKNNADRAITGAVDPDWVSKKQSTNTKQNNKTPLQYQNANQLWDYWKNMLAQSELQQIPIVNALLAARLRNQTHPDIYDNIDALLRDPDFPIENKALLLDLLSETATPESLALLLELIKEGTESPLYAFDLQAIARIGENLWNGQFHEELSEELEGAWSDPPIADEAFLIAVGKGIANIGAASGISLLLQSVPGSPQASKTTVKKNDAQIERTLSTVAFKVLKDEVHNPSAITPLNDCLEQSEQDSPASEVCITTLPKINTLEATKPVLKKLLTAKPVKATSVPTILCSITAPDSQNMVIDAANSEIFASAEVQSAVSAVASDFAAGSGDACGTGK